MSSSLFNTHLRDNLSYLYDNRGLLTAQVRYSGVIAPAALAADTHNYDPFQLAICSRIMISATGASRNLTGIAAQGDGTVLYLDVQVGSQQINLRHLDGSSSAANQLTTPNATTLVLSEWDVVFLMYNAFTAKWRVYGVAV